MSDDVTIRPAVSDDGQAVAALHTANWRDAYRGLMPDEYLDGALAGEMQAAWARKFAQLASGDSAVLVAERSGKLLGFIRVALHGDPAWGHYIDNLHVAADARGLGLGRKLFEAGAAWALERGGDRGLYLYVYADNEAARGTYTRWRGREVERFMDDAPHGGKIPAVRVAWKSCAAPELG